MRPRATTRTQKTTETETEAERMNWAEEFIILDCLNPILYQLPVRSNGFLRRGGVVSVTTHLCPTSIDSESEQLLWRTTTNNSENKK